MVGRGCSWLTLGGRGGGGGGGGGEEGRGESVELCKSLFAGNPLFVGVRGVSAGGAYVVHESVVAASGARGDVCGEAKAFVGASAAGLSSCNRDLVLGDSVPADLLCRRHHYHPEHCQTKAANRETQTNTNKRRRGVDSLHRCNIRSWNHHDTIIYTGCVLLRC